MQSLLSETKYHQNIINFLFLSQIGSNAVYILFVAQNILPVRLDRHLIPDDDSTNLHYYQNESMVLFVKTFVNIFYLTQPLPWQMTIYHLHSFLLFKKYNALPFKIVESHLAPGWNYRIYIGLLVLPVLAICRSFFDRSDEINKKQFKFSSKIVTKLLFVFYYNNARKITHL